MLKNLKNGHPRLFADDFAEIAEKCKTVEYAKGLFGHVKEDCDAMLSDPDFYIKGNDMIKAQIKIFKLALAYKLTGNAPYKAEVLKNTEKVHELFHEIIAKAITPILSVAMMAEAVAVAYDWLYDDWSDEERELLRHILKVHVIEHMLEDFNPIYNSPDSKRDTLWTRDYNNVQHIGCAGGIIASIALGDEYPELCEGLMDNIINKAFNVDLYRSHGVYPEGQYWNYSTYHIVMALAAMDFALGTDFGFSDKPGLSETGYFNIASTGPADGNQMKFADANPDVDRRVHNNPAMIWMGNRYNRPEYIWWERRVTDRGDEFRFPDRVMGIIWYDEKKDTYRDKAPELPLLNVMEGDSRMMVEEIEAYASVVTIRDEWFNPDSAWIGLKAGGNPTHHGQIDVGTFMISINDVDWLCELGWESYGKKGQFEGVDGMSPWHRTSPRWLYYRNRAEGHNTLVINPGETPTEQNVPAFAPVVYSKDTVSDGLAVIDMTELYNGVTDLKRGIRLYHGDNKIIVQDEIIGERECDIYWFAHTRAEIEIVDRHCAKLKKDGKTLYALLKTESGNGEWSVREAKRFECSPKPLEEDSENEGIKKLCVNLKTKKDTISVMFTDSICEFDIIALKHWENG